MKKSQIIILTIAFFSSSSFAQEFNAELNRIPPSPTVQGFQKYGDIPISYYTGTPQIEIPLYDITSYDNKLSIFLSYHASGIKLTNQASWVGAGWNLNAGGNISRVVYGLPDYKEYISDGGGSYFNNPIPSPGIDRSDDIYIGHVLNNEIDSQPDLYYFNFMGLSGKFSINQDKEILIDPNKKLKIIPPISSENPFWVIINSEGYRYTFGRSNSREFSLFDIAFWYVSDWALSQIESPSGNVLTFHYHDNIKVALPDSKAYRYRAEYLFYLHCSGSYFLDENGNPVTKITDGGDRNDRYKATKLDYIDYTSNGMNLRMQFVSSKDREDTRSEYRSDYMNYYKLNEVQVIDLVSGALLNRFVLNYDNFTNNLWLKSVQKQFFDLNGNVVESVPPYQIDYLNHENFPNTKSYAQDYWGYYNGVSSNTTLLPKKAFYGSSSKTYSNGAERFPSTVYMKTGIIKRIKYPTGGYTDFEFEPHDFSNYQMVPGNINSIGGGLRIKKTISATNSTDPNKLIKTYQYYNPENPIKSSGKIQVPVINYVSFIQKFHSVCSNGIAQLRTTHNLSSKTLIGYDVVIESIGQNGEGGRNIYYFYNEQLSWINTGSGYQSEKLINDYPYRFDNNGKLLKHIVQKKNGGIYKIVMTTKNFYSIKNDFKTIEVLILNGLTRMMQDGGINAAICRASLQKCSGSLYDVVSFHRSNSPTPWLSLDSTTTTEFSTGGSLSKIIKYTRHEFSSPRELKELVRREDIILSDKQHFRRGYSYPFQLLSNPVYREMSDRFISKPISSGYSKITTASFAPFEEYTKQISSTSTEYEYFTSNSSYGTSLLPKKIYKSYGSGSELETEFISYNQQGQPTEVLDAKNDIRYAIVWDDDRAVAQVMNAKKNQFFYQNFETDPLATIGDAHTGKKYKSGDYFVSFTIPDTEKYSLSYWYFMNGIWHFKVEDFFLPKNLTLGSAIDDIAIYPNKSRIKLVTYEDLKGLSSITDENGNTQFFEYDEAYRLKLIRDNKNHLQKRYHYHYKTY